MVGILLLLTLALRVRGLPGGGPTVYDEGWSVSNGHYWWALLTHPRNWTLVLPGHHHVIPFGHGYKLGHDLILGSLVAAGVAPENLTWFSAAAGALMVIAVSALAWRRWGAPAAAIAGVFAGAAPLTMVYGHRILAEADSLAGLAVALWLWDRWWDGRPSIRLALATVLAFLATMSLNYRLLPTLLPILFVLAWLGWRYRRGEMPPASPNRRLVILCLMPTVAVIGIYLLVLAGTPFGLRLVPTDVHDQFIRSSAAAPLPFAFPDVYPRTLWEFAGPASVLAAGLGVAGLLRNWNRLDPLAALSLGSLAGTFLFFSAVHDKAPRAIVICIPFAALVVARGVTFFRGEAQRWLAVVGVCGACLLTGWTSSAVAREESGTAAAGRWLAAHPGVMVALRAPIYALYTQQQWDLTRPSDPAHRILNPAVDATVSSLRETDARWVVVDADTLFLSQSPVFTQLVACGRPAAEFNDPADWSRLEFLETADTHHLGYPAMLAIRRQTLEAGRGRMTIRIYDLHGPGTDECR
jgi:hypothetical protein